MCSSPEDYTLGLGECVTGQVLSAMEYEWDAIQSASCHVYGETIDRDRYSGASADTCALEGTPTVRATWDLSLPPNTPVLESSAVPMGEVSSPHMSSHNGSLIDMTLPSPALLTKIGVCGGGTRDMQCVPFSPEEDSVILEGVAYFGNTREGWRSAASLVAGRTWKEVGKRYQMLLGKTTSPWSAQ
ncbi:hypothetical protein KIPB_000235 [Kipferlia bialata]|uniref:Myb-like domain-containing protein n=1 Tax=Kipferlia bialata TaxID=797122 RepID=A0A9K3GDA6_9EUKA|nr:hypothetical protein KIPB_000235 [Kipferlia bialata]|eukprot:g235.t1